MQRQLGKYLAVGLLAVTLTGAALVGESSAQWGRFATPYNVNYNANFYPAYPVYGVWRPFGGLFAGLHADLHGLLCHKCWLSPCCCGTPVICDPCFDPCCDPCGDPCCGFGYSGYYERPASLSVGVPSSTGFGSITPSEGVHGQRPVGVPSVQRPAFPQTGRTLTTPPNTYIQGVPNYNNKGPNLAPPRTNETFDPAGKIDDQINNMPRNEPFVPDLDRFRNDQADAAPSTGADTWINQGNSSTDANQPETAPPDGTILAPQGTQPQGTPVQPGTGNSTNHMMNLGTGTISVTVPESAKVYINGYETKMPGVNRKYVVNDLEPGRSYDYEVRIVAQANGRTIEEMQYVTLATGQQGMVAFGKPQPQPQSDSMRYIAARPVQ